MRKHAVLTLVILVIIAGCAISPQDTELGRVDVPHRSKAMYVDLYTEGDYVYTLLKEPVPAPGGTSRSGLEIVDISYPKAPRKTGEVQMPGEARSVYVSGNYAYVACRRSGLQIVDISDESSPIIVANLDALGSAVDIHVSGDYAYAINQDRVNDMHLKVIDISDRRSPVVVGNAYTPGTPYGVYVLGDYAYVAANHSGLQIIDVSDKANPVNVGGNDASQERARDVYVSGDYACVAQAFGIIGGLKVIDISDKAKPVDVGVLHALEATSVVYASGNYAYLMGDQGMQVIDISDKAKPMFIGRSECPLRVTAMAIDESKALAFLACIEMDESGEVQCLQVLDISDKASPVVVGNMELIGDWLRQQQVSLELAR